MACRSRSQIKSCISASPFSVMESNCLSLLCVCVGGHVFVWALVLRVFGCVCIYLCVLSPCTCICPARGMHASGQFIVERGQKWRSLPPNRCEFVMTQLPQFVSSIYCSHIYTTALIYLHCIIFCLTRARFSKAMQVWHCLVMLSCYCRLLRFLGFSGLRPQLEPYISRQCLVYWWRFLTLLSHPHRGQIWEGWVG